MSNSYQIKADEGLWLPMLLGKNYADMLKKGLKLSIDDIYSINHSSLKDAVVCFGGGCTGTLISNKGLVLTNYQCAYGDIRYLSDSKRDIAKDGFWAKNQDDEIPCLDMYVTFLKKIDDVSEVILYDVYEGMSEDEREKKIKNNIDLLERRFMDTSAYEAKVLPFFGGTTYYVFITQEFTDIRLVGVPPQNLGNFGGITDNWHWPRHTCDFALFRIYANYLNHPSQYSPNNIQFMPEYFFKLSTAGVKENDFAMIYGYPGTTNEYLASQGVRLITDVVIPHKINIRDVRLNILKSMLDTSEVLKEKYQYEYAIAHNFLQKAIGEAAGLKRSQVAEIKDSIEMAFNAWAVKNKANYERYGGITDLHKELYKDLEKNRIALEYINETTNSVDLLRYCAKLELLLDIVRLNIHPRIREAIVRKATGQFREETKQFFKDFDISSDKKVFIAMLKLYHDSIEKDFHPKIFDQIEKKYKNNFQKYADDVYSESFIANRKKIVAFLIQWDENSVSKIIADPAYQIYKSFDIKDWKEVRPEYFKIMDEIKRINRLFIEGYAIMNPTKKLYPDGNSTLRLSYGSVKGYEFKDGIAYRYYSTLEGVIQKYFDNDQVYAVPNKILELYMKKDYGDYAKNDTLVTCFLTDCHTTGGNSGSPVMNGKGQLIGIHFDRTIEGVQSDYYYDPNLTRQITLDIRYILFIIDKFAGAQHIMKELSIVP